VRRERGRFRSFLLASLDHFIANDLARRHAQKRGGGVAHLPLAFDEAECRYQLEPTDLATPETLYERRWALTVIDRVLSELRQEWVTAGRGSDFELLKPSLLGQAPPGGYEAIAVRLGSTEGAVRVAVHRLRKAFQERLHRDIAETVSDPTLVDDEIRHLVRALQP